MAYQLNDRLDFGSGVSRKDIQESQAMVHGVTPQQVEQFRALLRKISNGYNGYAHGSYSTTTELYEGGTYRFYVRGMAGTPRPAQHRRTLAQFIVSALNVFATLAFSMGMNSLFNRLVDKRVEFFASATISAR